MKAVIQRVSKASVTVDKEVVGQIKAGLVVLIGVAGGDTEQDVDYLAEKTAFLRIFADADGKFNLSALDTEAEVLVVSQFTLLAETKKGRRPSFAQAAPPVDADNLIKAFISRLKAYGLNVECGQFQAKMSVEIINDGPVTIILDSRNR